MKTLDKVERQVLLRKYMNNELNFDQAIEKLDKFHDKLRAMRDKLRQKGKSDEDISTKFKQEFYKLCQKLET